MDQLDSTQARSPQAHSVRGLLALLRCRGVGGQRALRLALRWREAPLKLPISQNFGRDLDLLCAQLSVLGLDPALTRRVTERESIRWCELISSVELAQSVEWAARELDRQRAMGARVIGFFDHHYPELLRLIPRPPPIIFARGDLRPLNRSLYKEGGLSSHASVRSAHELAIVGTRRPSARGLERATQATHIVARRGSAVISGLALGIDGRAHRAALDAGAYTVGVLGHGLDQCYPPEHRELAEEIIDSGGALLSEQPWGVKPIPRCLVARDRIQAGLSAGVLIAETSALGGALHAGRAALAQSRWLALPQDHRDALQHLPMIRDLAKPKSADSPTLRWLPEHEPPLDWFDRCEGLSRELHERAQLLKRSLDHGSEGARDRSRDHSLDPHRGDLSSSSTQSSLFEDL